MGRKRKYIKRQKPDTGKEENLQDLIEEIKALNKELATLYANALLSIREDLIRSRARIKERQHEE